MHTGDRGNASPVLLPGPHRACASHRLLRKVRRQRRLERPSAPMPGGLSARAAGPARLLRARASLPHRAACDLPSCGAMLPAAACRLWGPRLGLRGAALRLARCGEGGRVWGADPRLRAAAGSKGMGGGRVATLRGPVCGAWKGRLGPGDLGRRYRSSPASRRRAPSPWLGFACCSTVHPLGGCVSFNQKPAIPGRITAEPCGILRPFKKCTDAFFGSLGPSSGRPSTWTTCALGSLHLPVSRV